MLKQKIQDDLKQALLARDIVKTSTLRMALSALSYVEIAKGKDYEATGEDVLSVIQQQVKQHQESIEAYVKAGRTDLVAQETNELGILQSYLPTSHLD